MRINMLFVQAVPILTLATTEVSDMAASPCECEPVRVRARASASPCECQPLRVPALANYHIVRL